MHIYETPEINMLKLAFAQNTNGLMSDADNSTGDGTEEDVLGGN